MNILLTNDDGIYADGIYVLYKELKKIGNVTVVAPDSEKSSVSHGITLAHPILSKKINRKGKFFGHAVTGTPADCVKFAISVLMKKKPDVVVSGINQGRNDGCSVFYSGTVAGAREGALLDIPALAISIASFVSPKFGYAAQLGAKLTRLLHKNKIPPKTFLNVNVPDLSKKQIKGIKFTRQGTVPIHGTFAKRRDPNFRTYYWMGGNLPKMKNDVTVDTYALAKKYVTITPTQCDMTDYKLLEQISAWKL